MVEYNYNYYKRKNNEPILLYTKIFYKLQLKKKH